MDERLREDCKYAAAFVHGIYQGCWARRDALEGGVYGESGGMAPD